MSYRMNSVLEPGTVIANRYQVMNLIGRGGMSRVYLVNDMRLNKVWALKEVLKLDRNMSIKGIIAEVALLVKLDHPNLPRIIDTFEFDDCLYIVMDYIDGESLNDVLKKEGPQPLEKVIKWALQLCDALGYLHAQDPPIIYRDMKPSNIILKSNGELSLIDFGTAREYKREDLGDTTYLGTRGYAAPEQFGGRGQTDQRTDIYGVGATMYTLLTGQNMAEMQFEIRPISWFRPELEGSMIEKIIAKCCAPERDKRYQSCSELGYDLSVYNESGSVKKTVARKTKRLFGVIGKDLFIRTSRFDGHKPAELDKEYQVFISFKNTDDYGNETPDSRMAEVLYKKLRAKGIKVYFSKRSIENEGADKYKYSISNALKESRILVVTGTRPDYMSAPWIKREYREFRSKMKRAKSADEYAIFNFLGQEMHVNSLPEDLKDFTSYVDVEKLKDVIVSRLSGTGRQEEMPREMRAGAVWEQVQSGTVIKKRYQLYRCVKEGNYYKLFEAADLNVDCSLRFVKVINNYLIEEGTQDPEIECLKLISDVSRGVPSIYDYGEEEDITYIVTSFAQGTRLDKLMKNGFVDEGKVIQWMRDICDTLHCLHTHHPQIVHCNIKPSNIFIDSGKTMLINFSAAYVEGHKVKYRGVVVGSKYRAPELTERIINNRIPGPAADIYSLGYTMREVLLDTERTPSAEKKSRRKCSRGLFYILQRCTSEDPSERYQNVQDLKNDLSNIHTLGIKSITEGAFKEAKRLIGRKKSKYANPNSAAHDGPETYEKVDDSVFRSSEYHIDSWSDVPFDNHFDLDGFGHTVVLGLDDCKSKTE